MRILRILKIRKIREFLRILKRPTNCKIYAFLRILKQPENFNILYCTLGFPFLADRTNGRAIGTVLRLSVVCLSVCDVMYCG